jgi:hypothetical protein
MRSYVALGRIGAWITNGVVSVDGRNHNPGESMSKRNALLLIAAGLLASTTGCIHVSQRAIDNGRSMTSSLAYQRIMSGNVNRTTLQELYWRSNSLQLYARDLPYAPFGNNW